MEIRSIPSTRVHRTDAGWVFCEHRRRDGCKRSTVFVLSNSGRNASGKADPAWIRACGTYTLPLKDEYSPGEETTDKVLYNQPQFTNVKALKAFAARMKGVNGYKKISRALRFIADGSASPMETILFILLTLPYKLGGFGLPAPVLNRRIDIENPAKRGTRKTQYKCDLFWPKAHVAVEYDSDFYHTGADRIARDSKKRLDLEAHGVTVIPMTSRQIRNPDELEKLARLIARRLRKRLQYKNPQFKKAQRELRSLLL